MNIKVFDQIYQIVKEKYFRPYPRLKLELKRANFFEYLFKQRWELINWNDDKDLFIARFFSIKLQYNFKKKLDQCFNDYILPVKLNLDKILNEGWRWKELTLKEYNLLVVFSDFCIKFNKLCDKIDPVDHSFIDDRLFILTEEAFYRIISSRENIDIIISSLEKILLSHKKTLIANENKIALIISQLDDFFSVKYSYGLFCEFVLAYNMVKYNRFIEMHQLKTTPAYEIIQTDFYDCSKDTFIKIVNYIHTIIKSIKKIEAEKNEIEWLKDLSTIGDDGQPYKLITFFNRSGYAWKSYVNDAFPLLMQLIKMIIQSLDELFKDKWDIMTNLETIITIHLIDDKEIISLYKELLNEYEYIKTRYNNTVLPRLSINEFINATNIKEILKDQNQYYIYQKITNIFSILRNFAAQLRMIYQKKDQVKKYEYLKFMIEKPVRWRGESAYAVLYYYIELFIQMGGFFKEKYIIAQINKLSYYKSQLQYYNERLLRLLDSNRIIEKLIRRDIEGLVVSENELELDLEEQTSAEQDQLKSEPIEK